MSVEGGQLEMLDLIAEKMVGSIWKYSEILTFGGVPVSNSESWIASAMPTFAEQLIQARERPQ